MAQLDSRTEPKITALDDAEARVLSSDGMNWITMALCQR